MEEKNNKWKPILIGIWMLALVLLLVFYIIPQEEALETSEIKKLQTVNEKLVLENGSLDTEIVRLKKQSDSLSGHITKSHQTIQKLETELNEKINRINTMSTVDLFEYFSKFDTIRKANQ